ncbi:hypothetical protein, partial [Paenibacillus thiaminolyticus]|uniref:hypothetical protein n=1 Tax=Paenibacillus thiaminolyticus TaxID=49283 RepID=UPI00227E8168
NYLCISLLFMSASKSPWLVGKVDLGSSSHFFRILYHFLMQLSSSYLTTTTIGIFSADSCILTNEVSLPWTF